MHQLPAWFHAASVGFMFWAELVAPFLVFGPRRVRMVGFWSLVLLQVLIAATGNYGFFNLLSIVLCLTLVEDRDWGRTVTPTGTRRAPARGGIGRLLGGGGGGHRDGDDDGGPGSGRLDGRLPRAAGGGPAMGRPLAQHERLRAVRGDDDGAAGDHRRGQRGRRRLAAVRVPLEAGRRWTAAAVHHAAHAPAGLADVVRGARRRLPDPALVPRLRAPPARRARPRCSGSCGTTRSPHKPPRYCGPGCSTTGSPVAGRSLVAEGRGRDVLPAGGVVMPGRLIDGYLSRGLDLVRFRLR